MSLHALLIAVGIPIVAILIAFAGLQMTRRSQARLRHDLDAAKSEALNARAGS